MELVPRLAADPERASSAAPANGLPGRVFGIVCQKKTKETAMDLIRTLLEQQPLMALFLTIAIGYLVGEINIKGFSLGVGAVLFVALAVGWLAPKAVPAAMVGTLGLALFLYAVGVQYGRQFVLGLTSTAGRRANGIALDRRADGRRSESGDRKNDGPESGPRPRSVRGLGDQHADAAGGHRDARQRRPGGRLFGFLPVRRGRTDPVPLFRIHVPQAEDRYRAAPAWRCSRSPFATRTTSAGHWARS